MGMNWGAFAGAAANSGLQTYLSLSEQQRRDELLKLMQAEEGRKAEEAGRISAGMQRAGEVEPVGAPVYGAPAPAYGTQGAGPVQAQLLADQEAAFGGKVQPGTVAALRSPLAPETAMPPSKPQTIGGYQMGMAGALAGTTPQATLEAAKLAGVAGEQFKKEEVEGMLKNFNTARTHVANLGQQLLEGKISVKEYIDQSNPYYATVPNGMSFAYRPATDDAPEMVGIRDDKGGAVKQWVPATKENVAQAVTAVDAHMRDAFRSAIGSTSLDAWKMVDEYDLKKGKLDVDKATQASTAKYQEAQTKYHQKQGEYIDAQIKSGNWGIEDYHKAAAERQRDSTTREKKLEVEQRAAADDAKKAAEKYKDNPTSENLRNYNIAQEHFLNTQGKGALLKDEFENDRKWIDTQAANMAKNAGPDEMPKITAWREGELKKLNAHVGGIEMWRNFSRANDPKMPAEILDQAVKKTSKDWTTNDKGDTVVKVGKFEVVVPLPVAAAVKAREAAMGGPGPGGPGPVGAAIATPRKQFASEADAGAMLKDAERNGAAGKQWVREHYYELNTGDRRRANALGLAPQ